MKEENHFIYSIDKCIRERERERERERDKSTHQGTKSTMFTIFSQQIICGKLLLVLF